MKGTSAKSTVKPVIETAIKKLVSSKDKTLSSKKPVVKPRPGKLDECTKPHVAETYRLEDDDDACNDSVQ